MGLKVGIDLEINSMGSGSCLFPFADFFHGREEPSAVKV